MKMDIDIKGSIKSNIHLPLHSWDIYAMELAKALESGKKAADLKVLQDFQERFDWQVDLRQILLRPYEAIVLTSRAVKIRWVNDGFHKMTGYTPSEVKGKNPKIFQGKNTSEDSVIRIRERLFGQHPFAENIVNYRKNGEEYMCRVEIFPLINGDNELTHFMALEREIK